MAYALKAAIADPSADRLDVADCKTMYAGKSVVAGDRVYLFDSAQGRGLVARGVVLSAAPVARTAGVARQTPRVRLTIRPQDVAQGPLGRVQLKPFDAWDDGRPQTELNFKLYRQATDKLVGLSEAAARFLDGFFTA